MVCEIKTENGKIYKPRCFLNNSKLIEVNENVINNPALLAYKVIEFFLIVIFFL
jgi:hypothetical protein